MSDSNGPPQVPGPLIDEALKQTGAVNVFELEKRVSALEAKAGTSSAGASAESALAGVIGHVLAGARTSDPSVMKDPKSASQYALDWFATVSDKYFPQPKILSGPPPVGVVGVPYPTYSFGTRGYVPPFTYSIDPKKGALPQGLTLNEQGALSGTPNAPGAFSFTVLATDSTKPVPKVLSQPMTIVVDPAKPKPADPPKA